MRFKKLFLVTVLSGLAAGGVFAEASLGGGGIIVPSFGSDRGGAWSGFGGGLNVFFNLKHFMINANLIFDKRTPDGFSIGLDTTNLVLGIGWRFPFATGEKIVAAPFFGFDYNAALDGRVIGIKIADEALNQFNSFSLVLGLGLDYNITQALYIRCKAGFGDFAG